jgi:RHS repeat-associated protein
MNSADCLLEENETQAVHGSTGCACRIIYCISKQCSNGAYFSQFVGGIVGSDPEECRGRASIAAAKQFRQNIRHGASCAGPRQRKRLKVCRFRWLRGTEKLLKFKNFFVSEVQYVPNVQFLSFPVCFTYGTTAASFNNGLPLSMTDPSGSETYTYNSLEQITQRQKVVGSTTYNTSYAYNFANELSQVTYPSGRVVVESYDTIGRLCAVGTSGSTCTTGVYAYSFGYNTAQQVTGFHYGNNMIASYGYSPDRLQLTSLSHGPSGTAYFALGYTYGAAGSNNGLISQITDTPEPGKTANYTYDSLNRLSTAVTNGSTSFPQWGLKWTYDRYGNRTVQQVTAGTMVPSNSVTVDATTNRITGSPYSYDAGGNLTNDGLNTLTYDGENRTATSTNGSSSGAYTYDGGGLRVKRVSGTTTTVYVFSGSKVVAEYDNGAAPTAPSREYIYSGATLLAKIDSTGTKYFHRDHLSNRMVTDSTSHIVEQMAHYPYGESWYNTAGDKLFFTTYERDTESGNDYAQARYYANRLGRFSSVDPLAGGIDNPQSLNRYSYVAGNPVNLVDPFGTDCTDWTADATSDPSCFLGGYGGGSGGGGGSANPGQTPQCVLDDVQTPCSIVVQAITAGNTNVNITLSSANRTNGTFSIFLPGDCVSEFTIPTDPNVAGASFSVLGCEGVGQYSDLSVGWAGLLGRLPPGANGALQAAKQLTRQVQPNTPPPALAPDPKFNLPPLEKPFDKMTDFEKIIFLLGEYAKAPHELVPAIVIAPYHDCAGNPSLFPPTACG